MKVMRYLVFGVMIALMAACKKDILEIDPNYEGEWHTESETLDSGREIESYFIIEGNYAIYATNCDLVPMGNNCLVYQTGLVQTTKNQKLMFIGDPNKDVQLGIEIDELPHINSDGKWECTLMGNVFIKN